MSQLPLSHISEPEEGDSADLSNAKKEPQN